MTLYDERASKTHSSMMRSFNQADLNELFFELDVDIDAVPKPANKQAHVEYIIRYMFVRNKQKILTAKLKILRPHVNWPDTYTLNVEIDRKKASDFLYKNRTSEYQINSKDEIQQKIAEDLYEKIFKHTPKAAWSLLFLVLFSFAGLLTLYYFKKDFWADYGLLMSWGIAISIITLFSITFSLILKYLRKSTEYYDLRRVNDRIKVKDSLQKRNWGNKITNLLCYALIGVLLEPNLHKANRRKMTR